MVADPFDILGDEQQMGAGGDAARIFHHVGEQFAEQADIHLVQLFVAAPYGDRFPGIPVRIGIEDLVDHRQREPHHARDRVGEADLRILRQGDRPFRDVGRIIGNPLEFAGNLQRDDDFAQVARHGLAQRQQLHHESVDFALHLVDPGIGLDGAGRQFGIASLHRLERIDELRLGEAAHLGDLVFQFVQLLVERADDMFGCHPGCSSGCPALAPARRPSRTGR